MDLVTISNVAVAVFTGLQTWIQAHNLIWGSHSRKLVITDNAEGDPRILNEAVGVLLSHVKDSNKMVSSETCEEWISLVLAEYPSSLHSIEQRRNMLEKIKKLVQKIYEMMPERVVKKSGAPDISRFRTLQKPLEETLVLLEHDKIKKICIHGTVGIGKTTILRNLNNHEEVAKKFDTVIWLKVSKEESKENLSREDLLKDIAERLKLNIGDTSNACEKISMVLEGKRYLLLLDDVKHYLDLSEIGIPESNNCSKIVLTTRLLNDCHKMVDRAILVERLSEVEARRMFQDVLDEPKLIEDKKTMQVAMKLCKDCGRLPLVIEKVAKTFKWKSKIGLWVDGLNSWRSWAKKECQDIMELYELLKQFCYDNLDDDQYKKCFLYVALYPEDTDINKNDLLGCWEANNLLFSENTMIKGNSILHCLHQLSILEEGKSMDHVKMDKFIRQVAVYITEDYREHKHLVKASKEVKEPPDVHLWGEMNRISLGDNKLEKLPDSPDCPMLSTLFLQKNLCLKRIPDLFFKNMKKLGVLDLSHTGLILLPPSISSLDSLKILCLVDCKNLRNLPSDIDGLKQLETLDIRGNAFNNIPLQIEKLSCLRRL